jgi:hypothetical protein
VKACLLLFGLAAALPAESHWALRSVSSALKESPVEVTVPSPLGIGVLRQRPYPHDADLVLEQSLRSYGGAALGDWRAEWDLLGRAIESSDAAWLPAPDGSGARSRALEAWSPAQPGLRATGSVEQLNLRWQGARASFIAGRQSVNLGVGFFFSPLDVFAPFGPLDSYRYFRPGVDAVRASWSPSPYDLLELIAVAGYRSSSPGAPSLPPDALDLEGPSGQGSLLARAQANGELWSFTLQGGRLRTDLHLAAAVQIEAWSASWLLEGGWDAALAESPAGLRGHRWAWNAGFSRQWKSWLSSRFEGGASGVLELDGAPDLLASSAAPRAALLLEAQAGPLWTLSTTLLHNGWTDASQEALFSAERSLNDESALTLSVSAPILWGPSAIAADLDAPYAFRLELRTLL